DERVALAQLGDRLLVRRRAIEHLAETVRRFDAARVGGVSCFSELGRQDAVARRGADVQRLGHRAEIADYAARHRRGDAERHLDLRPIEAQKLSRGRGRAQSAESPRGVPAVLRGIAEREDELGAGLEARDVGLDDLPAARAQRLAQREDRRQDRRGGLAHHREAVIEIERVRGHAVGQGRGERGRPKALPPNAGLLGRALSARDLGGDPGAFVAAARERDAETIERRRFGVLQRLRRHCFVPGAGHELGDFFGYVHRKVLHSQSGSYAIDLRGVNAALTSPISIFPRVCYIPIMRIVQIPLLRDNYGYLAVCEETGETAVVDPSEADPVLERIDREKVDAKAILNTHHHRDHTGGNSGILQRHKLAVYGHKSDRARIPGITRPVDAGDEGDEVAVGKARGRVFFIPGHTTGHVAYLCGKNLFCGDTLFTAGCGRLFEGTAEQMLDSLKKLKALPADTLVYCGHEYTENNL